MKVLGIKNTIRIKEVERLFDKKGCTENFKPDTKKRQYKRLVYRPYTRKKEES